MSTTKILRQFARAVLDELAKGPSWLRINQGLCSNVWNTDFFNKGECRNALAEDLDRLYADDNLPFKLDDPDHYVNEKRSVTLYKNPKRLAYLEHAAYSGNIDNLLSEFAQWYLDGVEHGETFMLHYGMCGCLDHWLYREQLYSEVAEKLKQTLKDLLLSIYLHSEYPFKSSASEYETEVHTNNRKRLAFAKALTQGRLVTDDFGNSVAVKENFYAAR